MKCQLAKCWTMCHININNSLHSCSINATGGVFLRPEPKTYLWLGYWLSISANSVWREWRHCFSVTRTEGWGGFCANSRWRKGNAPIFQRLTSLCAMFIYSTTMSTSNFWSGVSARWVNMFLVIHLTSQTCFWFWSWKHTSDTLSQDNCDIH